MREEERLSELIAGISDAALDPSRWTGVLAGCSAFVGGSAAGLYSRNVAGDTAFAPCQHGLDPGYVRLYQEKYAKLDPTLTGFFFADIDEPVNITDVMPYDEFLETRFHREWSHPQGLVDSAKAVLEKSGTSAAMFVAFRHERDGLVDDDMRCRMRLIAPHVRRAVLIGRVLERKVADAKTLAETVDGIAAGMFLVGANGRIVHANTAGHAMLGRADVLHAAGGRLIANDHHANRTLADAFATAGIGDAAIGTKGIAVPLVAANGERYVAHVLPLTSGARRRAGATYAASAALFVHQAPLDTPSPPEAIAKAYKLTPTELRVLLAIVEVGGVAEVAEALGIAETTVKTHLGRLYNKTGTGRQSDLVKLVGRFSNPLRE